MTEPDNTPSLLVESDGPVAVLQINRPTRYNALNSALLETLDRAVAQLAGRTHTRAIVLTGVGVKAFSAGADLDELAGLDAAAAHRLLGAGQAVLRRIECSRVPVIAAVNGLALGGGFELMLACSFAFVSRNAALGLPESGLGLMPGYGGTQRLPRIVGPAVARHVMLTGARISADRAYELGLAVAAPSEPEELMNVALAAAAAVAERGPRATAAIVQAVDRGMDTDLETGLALETELAAAAVAGVESTEGIVAFKAKRPADFGPRL